MPWDGNGGWLGSWLLGAKQKGKKREKEERERERKEVEGVRKLWKITRAIGGSGRGHKRVGCVRETEEKKGRQSE